MPTSAVQVKNQPNAPTNNSDVRVCSICRCEFPISYFYRNSWYCKPCQSIKVTNDAIKKFGSIRNYGLWQRYRVTGEWFDSKVNEQNGVCAICKDPTTKMWETNRGRFVDHNHKTGQLRGILCIRCNTLLGMLEDEEFVDAAKAYLAEYEEV